MANCKQTCTGSGKQGVIEAAGKSIGKSGMTRPDDSKNLKKTDSVSCDTAVYVPGGAGATR